jgi:hypothetical protein
MMKEVLIRNARKAAAAASVALLVGSLVAVPAQAQSKQTIKKMDSTVNMKESGAAATTILGGEANLNVGGGSCTPTLLIIPSAQKPGKMPHLTTRWRG